MRILMLNHEFPPVGGGGGRVSYEIACELVQTGHEVAVVTTRFGNLPESEVVDGIEVHRVYSRRHSLLDNNIPFTIPCYAALAPRAARRALCGKTYHAIHAFFTLPAGWVGLQLKRTTHIPLVVSLQGGDVPGHGSSSYSGMVDTLSPLIASIWRKADHVVAVSEGLARTARRTARGAAICTIPNGIDTARFSPGRASADRRVPTILTVARLAECKGIHHLLQALYLVKQAGMAFRLNIVGEGEQEDTLRRLSSRLGLDGQVAFLGRLPHEALPGVYAEADLFASPSLTESFGQTFLEAMACGLPVIGTTVGGIPEVVGHEQSRWLVPPGNVDALGDSIVRALSDPNRKYLGERNAAYVREGFSWQRVASAYVDLYRSHTPETLGRFGPPSQTPA